MDAYSRISQSRNTNGNIPVSEILAYANSFELISSLEEFVDVIYMIDKVYRDKSETVKTEVNIDKGNSNGK